MPLRLGLFVTPRMGIPAASSWIISGGGHGHGCAAGRTRGVNRLVRGVDQRQMSTGGGSGCPGGAVSKAGPQQQGREGSRPSPMAVGAAPASRRLGQ